MGVTKLELLRVGVFVALVGAVYAAAALVVLRWCFVRLVAGTDAPARRLGIWSRGVLLLAAGGVLCMLYGRLVEPRWLEVTHHTLRSAKLPEGSTPLRIVHISDIHSDPEALLETRLPGVVAELQPDLILFTGDAANSPAGVPVFRECMARLAEVAPIYGVKGNWDVDYFPELERFAGTGVVELDGDSVHLDVRGVPLTLAGAAFADEGSAAAALADAGDTYTVFLYHAPYPDVIPRTAAGRVDLLLAGHIHGGQVALPFYGALITLSKFGKKYERGLYRVDEMWLHVSRGVGMEGGIAPRVRFCARPEVTLIEIAPDR